MNGICGPAKLAFRPSASSAAHVRSEVAQTSAGTSWTAGDALPDDALRAEVWRLLGRRVEVWARGGIVQRVELA